VVGDVELSSGPIYLIPPTVTFEPTAALELSAPANSETVTWPSPRNWSVEEGDELLGGALWALKNAPRVAPRRKGELIGPWVLATRDDQAIAICHTAAWSPRGAEAGVWTHPAFRGRGHAAAVTAAWASLAAPGGRRLFYSTDATDLSSQRVAARLNLRPIGWLWKLSRPIVPSVHRRPLANRVWPRGSGTADELTPGCRRVKRPGSADWLVF
jgi:RimJ/RimL family protein N-acetyltransferase